MNNVEADAWHQFALPFILLPQDDESVINKFSVCFAFEFRLGKILNSKQYT
jgi:hypothetical protein